MQPGARCAGVASALIEQCARLAPDRGCRYLKWQTASDHLRAQRVYDRTGAQATLWQEYVLPL